MQTFDIKEHVMQEIWTGTHARTHPRTHSSSIYDSMAYILNVVSDILTSVRVGRISETES